MKWVLYFARNMALHMHGQIPFFDGEESIKNLEDGKRLFKECKSYLKGKGMTIEVIQKYTTGTSYLIRRKYLEKDLSINFSFNPSQDERTSSISSLYHSASEIVMSSLLRSNNLEEDMLLDFAEESSIDEEQLYVNEVREKDPFF